MARICVAIQPCNKSVNEAVYSQLRNSESGESRATKINETHQKRRIARTGAYSGGIRRNAKWRCGGGESVAAKRRETACEGGVSVSAAAAAAAGVKWLNVAEAVGYLDSADSIMPAKRPW